MEKLPAQMTVVAISKPGGPEVLMPEQRALPQPRAGAPRRLIVDSQVHLWKANTPDRAWPAVAAWRAHSAMTAPG